MKKVSVVLPVYNEERYLKQCLDSLCGQTLKEIEIVCVDDGSTDNSLLILRDYEKRDSRIKVLTQKNQYAGAARNYGMDYAGGKYLLFLDSDDFVQLDMLDKLYRRAEQSQLDITICHYEYYDNLRKRKIAADFRDMDSFFPEDRDSFSGKDMAYAGIFQAVIGWAWDKLFRMDFVKECGYRFPHFRSSEDGFFVFMLMARAGRIGLLPESLVFHRIYNSDSLSNTMEQNWENGFKMLYLIREELERGGLYSLYRQSFISWAVEFQIYYLKAMHEKQAFYYCYGYIKEHVEPDWRLMGFEGNYLCGQNYVEQYRQVMDLQPEEFLFVMLREKEERILRAGKKGWVFPYELIPKGCRLILYGAGNIGREYYAQLKKTGYCSEVRLVDRRYKEYQKDEEPVESPEIILAGEFDYILLSIYDRKIQKDITMRLQSLGVQASKIISMTQAPHELGQEQG